MEEWQEEGFRRRLRSALASTVVPPSGIEKVYPSVVKIGIYLSIRRPSEPREAMQHSNKPGSMPKPQDPAPSKCLETQESEPHMYVQKWNRLGLKIPASAGPGEAVVDRANA